MKLWSTIVRWVAPPTYPQPRVRHSLPGETPAERLERIYTDASELLRRIYSAKPFSRREMKEAGMGGRRWASAYVLLIHAEVLDAKGNLLEPEYMQARRSLSECRERYAQKLRTRGYVLPF